MNTRDLIRLGVPPGEASRRGIDYITRYLLKGLDKAALAQCVEEVVRDPAAFVKDELRGEFARALLRVGRPLQAARAEWRQWGEGLEPEAVHQMGRACQLPIALAGALMPDAHTGYGLPIGGVLATDNVVIPFAVGVDIACRMKLSVFDVPVRELERRRERYVEALETETRFGVGAVFAERREHPVLDADWAVSPVTAEHRDRAWAQLGSSGSGNHFVEFGVFRNEAPIEGLPAGEYVALLSHSGSRGTGAMVCEHYSQRAMEAHPELAKEHRHLAWLSLESADGQEYWAAMELMGRYAAANHELIHGHLTRRLGLEALLTVENHHNFAWKERHEIGGQERDTIVHRKGATPAGAGVLGIIPGSMAAPGFLVRGKGEPASLRSASHGAGRLMSRKQALASFVWAKVERLLKERGVRVLSAGLDEAPMAYKDIHTVMEAQADLVEVLGRFDPKLVKMAPDGERAED